MISSGAHLFSFNSNKCQYLSCYSTIAHHVRCSVYIFHFSRYVFVFFFWCMFGSFNADFGCRFKHRALGECWLSFFSPYLNRTFYFLPSILLFVILILICFSRIITIRSVAFRCSRKYFIAVTLANTIIGRLLCCTRRVMCLFCIGCDIHCHLLLLTLRVFHLLTLCCFHSFASGLFGIHSMCEMKFKQCRGGNVSVVANKPK